MMTITAAVATSLHNVCLLNRGPPRGACGQGSRPSVFGLEHPESSNFFLSMKILNDLFLDELAVMYDTEQRLIRALASLAEAASSPDLREAFQSHQEETRGHVKRLGEVFMDLKQEPRGRPSEAVTGLLKEAQELTFDYEGSLTIDAALIAAAQKVEHYEIATYGCLHAWALLLKEDTAARILHQIMDEEKSANETLSQLALTMINEDALSEDP